MTIERPVLSWDGTDHSGTLIWILLIWALIVVISPRIAWWWEWWMYRDKPEPSELWIWVTRLGAMLVAGLMIWMLQHPGPVEISFNAPLP